MRLCLWVRGNPVNNNNMINLLKWNPEILEKVWTENRREFHNSGHIREAGEEEEKSDAK